MDTDADILRTYRQVLSIRRTAGIHGVTRYRVEKAIRNSREQSRRKYLGIINEHLSTLSNEELVASIVALKINSRRFSDTP